MESAVTDILEEELSTVEGLRTLTSVSGEQFSNITLEFNLNRSVESAAQDVRDKVSRVRGRLPREVLEPVIAKQDADAQPFYWLALSGENYSLLDLSDIGDRVVKQRLQSIPGVGNSAIYGERRISMRIWISAKELAARDLTVQDVETAIRSRNVEIPAGRIESENREFTVRSLGELKTPQEFGDLVVANQGGQLVRLKDLARVELGPRDERSMLRFNGTSAVAVGIVRQSKANMVDVADSIRAALPQIEQALPPGVTLRTAFDQSVYVKRSISETIDTLFLAFVLVVIVIFLFLRNMRATLVPSLAIPVSIVGAFGAMFILGYSVNTFTLLALILAIGLVVDDAIIVLENAYRHQEELGEDPEDSRHARHQRNRLRGHRHHHLAGGGLRAAGLPAGHHGAALQRVRRGAGRVGHHLRLRGADPHADALRQDPPGAQEPRRGVQGAGARPRLDGHHLRHHPRLGGAPAVGHHRRRGRRRWSWRT